ncbi:MAG: PqqD family protein [Nitrospira sp.]
MPDTLRASSTYTAVSHLDPTLLHQVVLVKNPDVQATNMDGETVLLDLGTGRYYTLNLVGSLIWELCIGQQTISDIHTVLCDRFDIVPERALDDLVTLVNQLTQEGLLQQERR